VTDDLHDGLSDGLDDAHEASIFDHRIARKDLLFDSAKILAAAAAAGPFFMAAEQAEAAYRASTGGGDPIATGAVNAAKEFRGVTQAKTNEAGLQALDDKNFSGPLWERLTGIKTRVVEAPFPQLYSKAIAEHVARSGALDVLEVSPPWIPDFAERGVVIAIDDLIRKHRAQSTITDLHPLYRALGRYKGKTYGFFDDGDIWILYYRKDVFANARLRSAYRSKFGKALAVPRTWEEFSQVAQFITDQMAPAVYGTGMGRALGNPGNQFYFLQQFRANGGTFFDTRTMRARINSAAGVRTMNQILAQNKASAPGIQKLDFVSGWVNWLNGKTAMMMAWPPTGRISENYAQRDKAFAFLPRSKVQGKVGYAVVPGRNGEMAGAFVKCIAAGSKNQEAAYLFAQWATSPSVSLQRVQLPYTLRDPYRISHYRSRQFQNRFTGAKAYLTALAEGANHGVLDFVMTGAADYYNSLDRAMTAIYAGKSVKSGLDDAAEEWNRITDRLGVEKQRASWQNFLTYIGSTRLNTPAKKGMAVKV
jgi:multiple sugar transport system substrate-binding protein